MRGYWNLDDDDLRQRGVTSLLADRGAVVVGGSRGIGAAVAALLAQHGAGVVVNGRGADAARAGAQAITAAGGRAVAHPGSPSDQKTAESLVDNCIDEFGGIHILINCAGIAEPPAHPSSTSARRSSPN